MNTTGSGTLDIQSNTNTLLHYKKNKTKRINKKVLLRERKRHTDRGVSSTTRGGVSPIEYPPLSWTWPWYPPPLSRCGQTDGWMDRHVSKHNLPSYYVISSGQKFLNVFVSDCRQRIRIFISRSHLF